MVEDSAFLDSCISIGGGGVCSLFEPLWDKCAIVTKIKNTKSAKSKNFLYLPMRESPVVHMSTTLLAPGRADPLAQL